MYARNDIFSFLRAKKFYNDCIAEESINFDREAKKFFNEPHNFRKFVHTDVDVAFFGFEFADYNEIDGHKVLSILINDVKGVEIPDAEEEGTQALMRSQVILYCRYRDISGLARDQSIRINGKLYTVKEFHEISNYVWRILLERNENNY